MRNGAGIWVAAVLAACNGGQSGEVPPVFEVTPLSLDFGVVPMDGESTLDVTLSNTGGGYVSVLTVTLTAGDDDIFSVDRSAVNQVGPGGSFPVSVTFTPEQESIYTGELQIRTDYAEQGTWAITLRGQGGLSDADYDYDGFSRADGDCDDGNASVYPGAPEVCDGVDNDCNGTRLADEVDADYDGWLVCEGDCDDANSARYPGNNEICDYVDNDCDNVVPDLDDVDQDGFSICAGDCDDGDSRANPKRAEVCDGVDNNCDTAIDDLDVDGDGHSVCDASGDCDDDDPNAYPVVVSTSGSSTGYGTEASPYDSLATAFANLDAVCRTVVVQPGTYAGVGIDFNNGAVTVVGSSGDPADVTLEAATYDRHFTVTGGATLTLRDLTLTAGDAPDDGGAVQVTNATLVLDQVILAGNTSANDGGAVAVSSGTLTIIGGTVFDGNTAADDGGALLADASTVTDDGSRYVNNAGTRGGAVYVVGGDVSFDDVEFRGNAASTEGGAIAATGAGDLDVERSWIVSNTSVADGGAFALRDVDSANGNLRNNRVQDNVAQGGGGAVAVLGGASAIRIVNNTFTTNEAAGQGAGVLVAAVPSTGVLVSANVLHDNDGPSAIHVASGSGAIVTYNTGYLTNSGVHFAGEIVDAYGNPLDPSNVVRNPLLVAVTDDGNPDNDDLDLQAGSPEIDSGPPTPLFDDQDGTVNDRGYTGGPAAP